MILCRPGVVFRGRVLLSAELVEEKEPKRFGYAAHGVLRSSKRANNPIRLVRDSPPFTGTSVHVHHFIMCGHFARSSVWHSMRLTCGHPARQKNSSSKSRAKPLGCCG